MSNPPRNPGRLKSIEEQRKEREDRLAERRKRAKKAKRRDIALTIIAGAGIVAGVAGIFALFVGLGALVFWAAWNWGVVPIVAAAGGSVGEISFLTALGGSLAVGILRSLFGRDKSVQVSK